MAKKKRKQNKQSSPAKATPSAISGGNRYMEDYAKAAYRERARVIKHDESLTGDLREGLDYDPVRQRRRIQATLATMEELKSKVQDICPDVPNIYSTEEEWIEINAFPSPAYDFEERYTFSALGCAIWILDQIRDMNRMKELEAVLPLAERLDEIKYPPIWDPCHSHEVLYNMVSAILHRNDPDEGDNRGSSQKEKVQRYYMSSAVAERKVSPHWRNRVNFNAILALIPDEAIDKAERLYQEKYWDFVTRYFMTRRVICTEDVKLKAEIDEFENRSKGIFAELQQAQTVAANHMVTPSVLVTQSPMRSLSELATVPVVKEYQQVMQKAQRVEIESAGLQLREQQLNDKFDAFGKEMWALTSKPYSYIEGKYGKEIADIWQDFDVRDPYEMCFAFMSLLDKGSDLPWCYCVGVNLHACYAAELPWPRMKFNHYNDGIWYHSDSSTDGFAFGPDETTLPKKIRVPEMDDWYKLQFEDKLAEDSDDIEKFNLAQIVYEVTGCIMPRRMDRYVPALKTFDRYGIRGKKALPLLYCMSIFGEARHRSQLSLLDRLLESLQTDSENEEPAEESSEDLNAQIRTLQDEVKRLKQVAYEAGREARDEKARNEALAQKAALDAQELHDLRELVFNQLANESEEEVTTQRIQFPHRTSSRIVVFGGHDSWAKEIKPKLPDVRFINREMVPNSDLIRRADVIWIQANALSHGFYYKIIDEARKYDIPVRYFAHASATKCAEQIVAHENAMNK